MSALLIDEPEVGVMRMRINRPEARNAINAEIRAALLKAVPAAALDPNVRVLLFASAGGTFCAGGDLPSMVGVSRDQADQRMREGHAVAAAIGTFPKPVVAAVERFAVGAGAGLALLADHVILADNAVLGFPFLKIGLSPDWGITATLKLRAGHVRASRILRNAETVAAAEAVEAGIADEMVAATDIERAAIERATTLARLPAAAFARMKTRLSPPDLLQVLDEERVCQVDSLTGPEFKEGYAALLAKRQPNFASPVA